MIALSEGHRIREDNTLHIKNSVTNTKTQQSIATLKRFAPNQAAVRPAIKLIIPDIFEDVEFIIAGKVITAKVT